MKRVITLLGMVIASIALVACGGGGSDPVKTEKVWKLVEKIEPGTFGPVKTTFEYDGSGKLIKQNNINSGDYVDFNYDNKGMLLTREEFFASGEIKYHIEFDSHGEVTLRSKPDTNGDLVPEITYINTYDDDRVVLDGAPKYNNTETYQNSYLRIYPASKLVSRKRGGEIKWVEEYSYEGNIVTTRWFDILDNSKLTGYLMTTYNEQGDIEWIEGDADAEGPKLPWVRSYEYIYTPDENGNISERITTEDGQSSTTTYQWESFDIPVE